mmetsp:Transcript_37717/g.49676  ORF Transcript_37717/g.49676 Transcript_37717/m.49676 type:complete len:416 (-) Transcript_37717:165-1412(-)
MNSLTILILTFVGLTQPVITFVLGPNQYSKASKSQSLIIQNAKKPKFGEYVEVPESKYLNVEYDPEKEKQWNAGTYSWLDYEEYEETEYEPLPTNLTDRSRFWDTHPFVEGTNRSRFLDGYPLFKETFEHPATDYEDDPECNEWFCVIATDKPGSFKTLREPHQCDHVSWARASWRSKGRTARVKWDKSILAEDAMSTCGNVYYIQAKSMKDAEALVKTDPYNVAGLYEDVRIFRWFHKQRHDLVLDQRSFPHVAIVELKKTQVKNARKDKIHMDHIKYYENTEKVYHFGPLLDSKDKMKTIGHMIEMNVDNTEEFQEIINNDPYAKKKMYKDVKIMRVLELDVSGRFINNNNRRLHFEDDDPVRADMKSWGLIEPDHDYYYPLYELMTETDVKRMEEELKVEDRKAEIVALHES